MKMLKTLAVFALAMCAALVRADPPTQVGRLNFISGPVSFAPAEASNDWTAAALNRPITAGDRLWADRDARAEMHVGSTAIRTTELTSVDVLNIDDGNIQLGLAEGGLNVHLRNLPGSNGFEVDTPHGAVILREPGSYRINVDPSGAETTVDVRSGQADVFTSASSFPVNANQQARITGTDFLSYDIAAAPPMDEFDRWAATRDRKEDRIASTRYVSSDMTGYEDLDDYGSWRVVGDYGSVWVPASVPAGWAPYRYGHWVWISPWGWTWVDNAPWGFAPFHYGRWVWVGSYWAWAPGPVAVRPVYAPALVAFVGGSNWSVSVGIGSVPVVGWVPLGWREPFIPWYRVSPTYVRNVNVAHVTNINVTNIYNNATVTHVRHANRDVPSGVTVVRREHFVSAKPVEPVKISSQALAAAPVTSASPVHTPERASFAASRPGPRPPAGVFVREVVAVNPPPARDDRANERANVPKSDRRPAFAQPSGERTRVRVINRQQRVELQAAEAQRGSAPAAQAQSATEAQRPQEQQAGRNRGERANEKGAQQAQPRTQAVDAKAGERVQEKAAPQAQPGQQAERRAPAPPPEVSRRPTFDREMRQVAPQPDFRATPRPAPEQRTEQQDRQRQQQAQEQQAREQQARQREVQQRDEERLRAQQQRAQQQAQEQQAREQQARQREMQQQVEQQKAQQQQRQQQAQEQQAREQQARQREMQQREEERQRAQQQRAQQQAQEQQAQQARQREMQQQQEQRLRQQREQRQDERAERRMPQPQAAPAAERRAPPQQEQAREKARDRQRAEKSDNT